VLQCNGAVTFAGSRPRIKLSLGAALTQFRPAATNIGEAIGWELGGYSRANPGGPMQHRLQLPFPFLFFRPTSTTTNSIHHHHIIIHNTFNKGRAEKGMWNITNSFLPQIHDDMDGDDDEPMKQIRETE
jgi:hypothetical protein